MASFIGNKGSSTVNIAGSVSTVDSGAAQQGPQTPSIVNIGGVAVVNGMTINATSSFTLSQTTFVDIFSTTAFGMSKIEFAASSSFTDIIHEETSTSNNSTYTISTSELPPTAGLASPYYVRLYHYDGAGYISSASSTVEFNWGYDVSITSAAHLANSSIIISYTTIGVTSLSASVAYTVYSDAAGTTSVHSGTTSFSSGNTNDITISTGSISGYSSATDYYVKLVVTPSTTGFGPTTTDVVLASAQIQVFGGNGWQSTTIPASWSTVTVAIMGGGGGGGGTYTAAAGGGGSGYVTVNSYTNAGGLSVSYNLGSGAAGGYWVTPGPSGGTTYAAVAGYSQISAAGGGPGQPHNSGGAGGAGANAGADRQNSANGLQHGASGAPYTSGAGGPGANSTSQAGFGGYGYGAGGGGGRRDQGGATVAGGGGGGLFGSNQAGNGQYTNVGSGGSGNAGALLLIKES